MIHELFAAVNGGLEPMERKVSFSRKKAQAGLSEIIPDDCCFIRRINKL
jgi:hypothetical protein